MQFFCGERASGGDDRGTVAQFWLWLVTASDFRLPYPAVFGGISRAWPLPGWRKNRGRIAEDSGDTAPLSLFELFVVCGMKIPEHGVMSGIESFKFSIFGFSCSCQDSICNADAVRLAVVVLVKPRGLCYFSAWREGVCKFVFQESDSALKSF